MLTILLTFILFTATALPHPNHHMDQKLSSHNHYEHGEHNADFDHDAFLGNEEARAFDELKPEESRRRLSIIYDKIDANGDGFVNASELTKWIQWTQRKYIVSDCQKQWKSHNPTGKEKLPWADYKQTTYGFLDSAIRDTDEYKTYTRMMERDRRRWLVADEGGDDALSFDEFQNFLHPEEVDNMQDVIVLETIEDIDKNGDGKISEDEYISDLFRGEPGDDEPAWVQSERETFSGFRDQNKDGYLDESEVKQWIMPQGYDHAGAESAHLIYAADADKDGKLTKDEVLDKYEVFVGSQATDFGEALTRHEEF